MVKKSQMIMTDSTSFEISSFAVGSLPLVGTPNCGEYADITFVTGFLVFYIDREATRNRSQA